MDVHTHPGTGIENHLPQLCIDFHGFLGVVFARAPGVYLKGLIAAGINLRHIPNDRVAQLLKALVLHIDHGADTGNAEHMLQTLHRLVKIKFSLGIHINTPLLLVNQKAALASFQGIFYLMYQRILKKIPVTSLNAYFRIFYQKSCKHIFPLRMPRHAFSPESGGLPPDLYSLISHILTQHRNFII